MPAQTYMVRRPAARSQLPRAAARSVGGARQPNACTGCHRRPPARVGGRRHGRVVRHGAARARRTTAAALHARASRRAGAARRCSRSRTIRRCRAIVRASAAHACRSRTCAPATCGRRASARRPRSGLRIAALGLLERFEPAARVQAAAPLLADPLRACASRPRACSPMRRRAASARRAPSPRSANAPRRILAALQRDRRTGPTSHVNLGNLAVRPGRSDAARIAAYETRARARSALRAAPTSTSPILPPARHATRDGESVLRRVSRCSALGRPAPRAGAAAGAQGRQGRRAQGTARAAKLAPDNARYAYVYAIGLHSAGKRMRRSSHCAPPTRGTPTTSISSARSSP